MTHTTQVLSDEQIEEIRTEVFKRWQAMVDRGQIPGDDYCDHELSRAIESATLKAVSGREPVASIYITADGAREFDDWKHDLPVGRTILYPAIPPAQPAPVDERDAFEAEMLAQGYEDVPRICSNGSPSEGEYADTFWQGRWEIWQARAALQCAQAPQAGGWLPIETAPKDGSMFICWVNAAKIGEDDNGSQYECEASEADFCRWRRCDESPDGGYYDNMAGQIADLQHITHWLPLPPAPQPTKGQP